LEPDIKEEEAIRQYLLGQALPEVLPQLEERLLTEGAFYEELLIVEDELIDQYLSGRLSASESKSFATHFLVPPSRQEKLRFALALNKYVSVAGAVQAGEDLLSSQLIEEAHELPEPPKPWHSVFLPSQYPRFSYSLAVALVLIVGTVSWFAWENLKSAPAQPGKILAVTLTPGLTRGEGETIQRISVPSDLDTLQLRLLLIRDDYPSYSVTVVRDDGSQAWNRANLAASNSNGLKFVSADTPARLLNPGEYQIKLRGQPANGLLEDISSYRFRVTR
jgi:hypothetical protein